MDELNGIEYKTARDEEGESIMKAINKERMIEKKEVKSEDDEFYVVEIQGKHGIIEMVFPKKPPTEEEIIELHRKIAESALRSHVKTTTNNR